MRRKLIVSIVVFSSIVLSAGVVKAASAYFDTLVVGKQGSGGVTYFNGTMINNTTTNGINNPITIADNLRVDGRVYRGATAGPGDDKPFIINDDVEITGDLTVDGDAVAVKKFYSGTIDITKDGDEIAANNVPNLSFAPPVTAPTIVPPCSIGYHFKKIAVPEISNANLQNIRVNVGVDATHQMGPYPILSNSWVSGTYSMSGGYVYLLYKVKFSGSGCPTTNYYYNTGKYQISVMY
jgi:hypothetical protein